MSSGAEGYRQAPMLEGHCCTLDFKYWSKVDVLKVWFPRLAGWEMVVYLEGGPCE